MFERLVDLRVMPYYLHQLDRVAGAAHFEVPEQVGIELVRQLRARLPGYAVPRYVRETPASRASRCWRNGVRASTHPTRTSAVIQFLRSLDLRPRQYEPNAPRLTECSVTLKRNFQR